jgi:tRNA threonylcarbamoyladenosine biosynthesis protein TsaB
MRTVLGFDTATRATAVALRLGDDQTLEARDDPASGAHPGHATRLLGLAASLLDRAGIGWRDLELIAVGLGPGTFTGLRIGVASARGLGASLGVPLSGVSSLAALAEPALAQLDDSDLEGVLTVLDARRGEAFVAAHTTSGEMLTARALPPGRLPVLLGNTASNDRWLAVGDGALRFEEILRPAGFRIPPADSPLHLISAKAICALGDRAPEADEQILLPEYCRRPDAEIALESISK